MKRNLFLSLVVFLALNSSVWAGPAAKIADGKEVTLTYKLFVNGKLLESADAKNPFIYTHGQHQIVPGLEKNLAGLRVGDKKTVHVLPKEGYGLMNPKAFREVTKDKLPPDIPLEKGTPLEARAPNGMPMLVKIAEVKEKTVVLDFNHPLAGKELEFQIEVLSVK